MSSIVVPDGPLQAVTAATTGFRPSTAPPEASTADSPLAEFPCREVTEVVAGGERVLRAGSTMTRIAPSARCDHPRMAPSIALRIAFFLSGVIVILEMAPSRART